MSDLALKGLVILDLSENISGPYCTKLLAGFGAEVVKIEKPGEGDITRHIGPFLRDDAHIEKSALFLHLNTGKKSITLNFNTRTGVQILKQLVKGADVLVESFSPSVMPSLGLSYEVLEKINPHLIMTSISYFGQNGPYRDHKATEMVAFALGGYMHLTGCPEREPLKACGSQAEYQAGINAALATMIALYCCEGTDIGQHVDVAVTESAAFMVGNAIFDLSFAGEIPERSGARLGRLNPLAAYPSTILPCKNGYVHVHYSPSDPDALATLTGEPKLMAPELKEMPRGHADEIDALMLPWLKKHGKEEIVKSAQQLRIPFTQVLSMLSV